MQNQTYFPYLKCIIIINMDFYQLLSFRTIIVYIFFIKFAFLTFRIEGPKPEAFYLTISSNFIGEGNIVNLLFSMQ